MEYVYLDDSWQKAAELKDYDLAISLIEREIGWNFIRLTNLFSTEKRYDPMGIYDIFFLTTKIKPQYGEIIKPFRIFGSVFHAMIYAEDSLEEGATKERILQEYIELEHELMEMMIPFEEEAFDS